MTRAAPDPLPTMPETADALRALLLAAWAERDSVVSERDRLAAERDSLAVECEAVATQNDRLRHLLLRHLLLRHLLLRLLLLRLRRMQFGARSERLPEEQLQLGLESLEQAIAQGEAETEQRDPALKRERVARRRASRGALPAHLPRIEVTLAPEDTACPCCRGAMAVIGHDSSERLDVVPAQFRVLVTRRPKLACRACEGVVVQAPAPARLIEGGLPTEALVAHVLVARYADHHRAAIPRREHRRSRCKAAVSPGRDDGEARGGAGPLHAVVLDGVCCGRDRARGDPAARDPAGLGAGVRRRDGGAGARSRPGPHQDGLLLGGGARRPALGRE